MKKLNYTADIVFSGDSITAADNFQDYITDKKVVNLGRGGDIIKGVTDRIAMVQSVSPEKVFLLIGINNLTNLNENAYKAWIDSIREYIINF